MFAGRVAARPRSAVAPVVPLVAPRYGITYAKSAPSVSAIPSNSHVAGRLLSLISSARKLPTIALASGELEEDLLQVTLAGTQPADRDPGLDHGLVDLGRPRRRHRHVQRPVDDRHRRRPEQQAQPGGRVVDGSSRDPQPG